MNEESGRVNYEPWGLSEKPKRSSHLSVSSNNNDKRNARVPQSLGIGKAPAADRV